MPWDPLDTTMRSMGLADQLRNRVRVLLVLIILMAVIPLFNMPMTPVWQVQWVMFSAVTLCIAFSLWWWTWHIFFVDLMGPSGPGW